MKIIELVISIITIFESLLLNIVVLKVFMAKI